MPPNPYGGPNYGHPGMMGMHGGGGGYGMGGGSGGGRGGVVPFRAGDWKCGNDGCMYHNFAKNVSCLRCGASRASAAVVAEGNSTNYGGGFQGASYGGPPPPNMTMPPMDSNSYGGMGPAQAYGGVPPGAFGAAQSFGPPSSYLPSGLGAPSPYMPAGYPQMGSNGAQQAQGGFDSRAEQAFNQGNASATGGAPGYSNGSYGAGGDGSDPFSFLSTGMGNLGLGERNGQSGAKSPQ